MNPITPLLLAALLAAPADGRERTVTLGTSTGHLQWDAAEVRLSGELRLSVTVEGPAPVRIEALPAPLIAGSDWRATPVAPAVTEPQPGERERWRQVFRVIPYRAGEAVPLAVRPLRFSAGGTIRELAWGEPIAVRVKTEVLQAELKDIRPPTGIEELPPLPATTPVGPWVAVGGGVVLLLALVSGLVWRGRKPRPTPPLTPSQQALAELDRLEQLLGTDPVPVRWLGALAEAVRRYLDDRLTIAARRRTTDELLVALRGSDRFPADLLAAAAGTARTLRPGQVRRLGRGTGRGPATPRSGAGVDRADEPHSGVKATRKPTMAL